MTLGELLSTALQAPAWNFCLFVLCALAFGMIFDGRVAAAFILGVMIVFTILNGAFL